MKSFKNKTVLLIIMIVLLVGILSSLYCVKENEFAYITQFSKFKKVEKSAGLKFKTPFIDSVKILPKSKMMYDVPPSEVLTGDKKSLVVDNFIVWQIEDPLTFMRTVGGIPEMENRIDATVYNSVKNKLGTMKQEEIINSDNGSVDNINDKITETVNQQLKAYGISIVANELKRVDLPQDNEQAVYNRMISERNQMAESFLSEGKYEAQKIINETNKEASILKSMANTTAQELIGQGEGEYMRILSDAYSTPERQEFYELLRGLEAVKFSMKGEKAIFLPSDSIIAKILKGN